MFLNRRSWDRRSKGLPAGQQNLVGRRLGEKFEGFAGGEADFLGGGGIILDFFHKGGGRLVMQKTEGDEGDHADLGILIGRGSADGGKDAGIFDADGRFDAFNTLDAEGVGHFREENIQAATVIESGEGEGGDDLGGAVFGLKGGEVGVGLGEGGKFQKGSSNEAANIGVLVLQHGEEGGDGGGVGAGAEEASGGGTGEPIGVSGGLAEKGSGLGGGEDAGGFDGFATNGGIGVAQGGAKNGGRRGILGRGEGEGANGEGADSGGGIAKG